MGYLPEPPSPLREAAERESWFNRADATNLLDWLENTDTPLLGIDVARKLPDGNWVLLLDPVLAAQSESCIAIDAARRFLNEHSAPDLMFEPVW